MLIRTPKDWALPESAVTPERDYDLRPRRDFLKTLGYGVAGLAGSALTSHSLLATTAGFPTRVNPDFRDPALKPTSYELITSYNNFYEFGTDKSEPKPNANKGWTTEPWTVEISGLINNPMKIDANDLVSKLGGAEQRVYRFRCVEAWSMVIPWDGFPLSKLIALADPKSEAKFVTFTTFNDPKNVPGQRRPVLDWPYFEGLRLDEANHDLSFIATGIYGKPIPNQNGAPLRLVVPWKYGFKYGKSIVKIDFVAKQPRNTWQAMAAQEYGFYANVNPTVDHPRWSQASERVIGGGGVLGSRQKTLMFNGYENQVAGLYTGMNLAKFY
ncbi:protein-methionine-sulfoxide reductase catalytic subunit MsrP [Horticoccus sp. 23ND18S-11]|uniref:protein-methionine-sulfoxide reductase catalytic subunit MsrP n=1 Tax=Horticoccus sp. 23ND18S-11 TaxID=3391832 RepID=UPI0039C901C9